VNFLGLNLTSTLIELFLLNALLAYSAFPTFALGRMNLSFLAFAGTGGYTAAILHQRYDVAPALGIAAGVALSAVVAVPIGAVLSRVRGVYLAIATVNVVAVFQIAAYNLTGLTGGAGGLIGLPIASRQLVLWLAVAAIVVLAWVFIRSDRGRTVEVQRSDDLLALSSGVNTPLNVSLLYVVSAAIGALQGGLTVFWYGFVSPDSFSFQALILAVAMVVVGGSSHWLGPLVGAAVFTILPEWLRSTGVFRNLAVGCILLLVVVFFPDGIVGNLRTRLRLRRARSSAESRARQLLAQ
jgi:branched-chain amino acid transport system permease protein